MKANTKNRAAAEKQKTREGKKGKGGTKDTEAPETRGQFCKIIAKFNIRAIAFTPVSRNNCHFIGRQRKMDTKYLYMKSINNLPTPWQPAILPTVSTDSINAVFSSRIS